MQEYNTQMANIKLPEYGRNVQQMVNYCKTIPDRERRNACARSIVGIMNDICPDLSNVSNRKNILWNHLALISNFELDIDYPCEVINQSDLSSTPEPIRNKQRGIVNRIYGRSVEELVATTCQMESTDDRHQMFELIANQMKRNFHDTYQDASEEDNKILQDLVAYAGEEFRDEIYNVYMYDAKELAENNQFDASALDEAKKKKKKKKKK